MYLGLEPERIALPQTRECVAFSAESRKVMAAPGAWPEVQLTLVLALQGFFTAASAKAAFLVDIQPWTDINGGRSTLITAYFATDAQATREQLQVIEGPFVRAGWTLDGVFPAPQTAFATLAVVKGQVHQLWSDASGPRIAVQLGGFGPRITRNKVVFEGADEKDFLPTLRHSVSSAAVVDPSVDRTKRQLKAAFALSVARRIVAADGVVSESEKAFVEQLFDPAELADLWLDDDELVEAMARDAPAKLPGMLGHHEKLALLSTFAAATHADAKVEVRELRVLREAAEALGLDPKEVMTQIQRLW